MRVLGIDLGLKRTGLAVSDETGIAIRLLPNLKARNRKEALEMLLSLIHELAIVAVVIGCPDARTSKSKAIRVRAQSLKEALVQALVSSGLKTKVYLFDEELSSKRGLHGLIRSGVPKERRKRMLDSAAAAILVEDFLQLSSEK